MAVAQYSALPSAPEQADAQRELDDAFESEDDHSEATPLQYQQQPPPPTVPGTYDFERDYDMIPPPGSPPSPSAFARPNDHGNSNGLLPGTPVRAAPSQPRPSFFRRLVGSVLPTHYQYDAVPLSETVHRTRGSGVQNDGVFANVTAKPSRATTVQTEDGEIHLVPEETQKEAPPSYAVAQLDAAPPYMSTVHAPAAIDFGADMIIEDLPSGSIWSFCINLFISFFFQFVGFLLSYMLYTSHAAKYGSRAGLGLTLIQYGFYSKAVASDDTQSIFPPGWQHNSTAVDPDAQDSSAQGFSNSSRDWLSFLLMTLGWFLFLSSVVGFWRVKRWERSIRAVSTPAPITREDVENDIAVRRNLETVFGIPMDESAANRIQTSESGHVIVIPAPEMLEEQRLARDLRAAGLL